MYGGEAWPLDAVLRRKDELRRRLVWSVVESIPVHKSIKHAQRPYRHAHRGVEGLARRRPKAGVKVVCYNFMPVVDWTRTDLMWRLPIVDMLYDLMSNDFRL